MNFQEASQNCHSSISVNKDMLDSSQACKIFCAVMAQAISIDYVPLLIKTSPELGEFQFVESHLSFPNQIEPKPPKQIV